MKIQILAIIVTILISSQAAMADDDKEITIPVNGADVGDFLGSGPVIDEVAMDKAAKKEQKYADLDPKKNVSKSSASDTKQQHNEIKKIGSEFVKTIEKATDEIGFPVGPDNDDGLDKDSF
jgi:hypothetical protein